MDSHDDHRTRIPEDEPLNPPKRKGGRCLFSFLLVALGLSIGLWIGFSISDLGRTLLLGDGREVAPPFQFGPNQHSILVVGVDRLSTGARLYGVWFVAYIPDQPLVHLVPLFPGSPGTAVDKGQALVDSFTFGEEVGPELFQAVKAQYNLSWDGYVLVDQFGMIEIIDYLGGVDLGEGLVGGAVAIHGLTPPGENTPQALQSQVALLEALCGRISPKETPKDVRPVQNLIPDLLRTNIDPEAAEEDWLRLVASAPRIRCEFPSLEVAAP